MERTLRIGEVAQQAGVHVQTLRFYERRGLMKEPPRRASGYRQYSEGSVQLVRFIKLAQGAGFSLKEIEQLLRLYEQRASCSEVAGLARQKVAQIDERMSQLRSIRKVLTSLLDACPADNVVPCPILKSYVEA